jgi:transposase
LEWISLFRTQVTASGPSPFSAASWWQGGQPLLVVGSADGSRVKLDRLSRLVERRYWPPAIRCTRYRERHSTSGAKSDAGDAHVLAEIVRLDHAHHRHVAGDSPLAEAVKLVARAHQSLIWDRTRQVLRLRSALREFFPAALQAFDDLTAGEALELLDRAPDPARAAGLPRATILAALRRAGRRDLDAKGSHVNYIVVTLL